MRSKRLLGLATAAVFMAGATAASAAPILFWSTQGTPVEEQQAIRDTVLKGFDGQVDFSPQDKGPSTPASRPKPRPARARSA